MNYIYILCAYLIGAIPTGVWFSKLRYHVDVRTLGSGNSGATNIGRNFGIKAAIFVTICDVLKGLLPVLFAQQLFPEQSAVIMATGVASILGHAYPIFAEFKGGKVVATSFGVLAGVNFPIGLITTCLLFLLIFLTSTISLSALTSYFLGTILIIVLTQKISYIVGFIFISLFMTWRHKDNIKRLLNGNERRINFGLRNPSK